ncbi:pimeloyl-ACP methyl ester carboxylesterase [Pontibacter ummariensis]|uniref:Pimeloyl-ACP methyl ester carboxylesterase n=1 Tax=Pontibacter ummariensis TaxID=1610492 RepID=A0A239KAC0_9BACT|nr:alpha/beta hydrolase [Pontibacter ummariensis]PRY06029.1 pimeloyl-ACP methyl ester carboxylesterase [Pontibacter ummariensis]SNT14064.1 Pimeloyl-ACP methyl ester carboxylesterase [Pontibacter ummariensis]
MNLQVRQEGEFQYIDEGEGEVLLLLHGLFGALSNWNGVVDFFSKNYRVIIPLMPIYEMPLLKAGVPGLVSFVEDFVKLKNLKDMTLLGNSLGGHVALVYTLNNPDKVKRLVLTGSSGLFEDSMGGSFPKRGNYDYVKERVGYTFYDPNTATQELVDEVFSITNSNAKCLRIISIAKSAQRHNMAKDITNIQVPTLLIWGLNDTITPPLVAYEFNRLMVNSELYFIDKCGHAPMMEHPEKFNSILERFLQKTPITAST